MSRRPKRAANARPAPDQTVLTKAFLRAGALLELSQKELAAIVGVSAATLSRIGAGSSYLRPDTKEGELAILFIRIFRSLDALLGGADSSSQDWLRSYNHHLNGKPLELMQGVRGLVDVSQYLDGIRGKA